MCPLGVGQSWSIEVATIAKGRGRLGSSAGAAPGWDESCLNMQQELVCTSGSQGFIFE